jgi:glycine oxidase
MKSQPDVLIIGGGVIGLTCAYDLAREGLSVTLADRAAPGSEASWAGAGILPAPPRQGAPLHELSARLFPELSNELRAETGIDNGYQRSGGIEVLADPEPTLREWQSKGIQFERLTGDGLRQLEPALALRADNVFLLPGMAQVRNPWHLRALEEACRRRSVNILADCEVTGLETQDSRITGAKTSTGKLGARDFLIATGAWTRGLLEPLGLSLPIRPIRGQIALLNAERPLFSHIVVVGKHYLVPRADGRVLIGSTEEDVGFDKRTTAQAITDLLAFAVGAVPALAGAAVERCWSGLRPGSPDENPFIGAVPGYENLFLAAGHFRSGIELSPATGVLIRDLLCRRPPALSLAPFLPDRLMTRAAAFRR